MTTNTKSTPVTENTATETVRISKRTGKPVRKYTKTGAAKLYAQGISPRTNKPVRKYTKTGAAALRKQGISPRTNKPVRKYTKAGTTVDEAGKVVNAKVASATTATGNVVSDTATKTAVKKASRKKVVKEVVASDE